MALDLARNSFLASVRHVRGNVVRYECNSAWLWSQIQILAPSFCSLHLRQLSQVLLTVQNGIQMPERVESVGCGKKFPR